MQYRKPVSKAASKANFQINAKRTDVRNLKSVPTRGGIRL